MDGSNGTSKYSTRATGNFSVTIDAAYAVIVSRLPVLKMRTVADREKDKAREI